MTTEDPTGVTGEGHTVGPRTGEMFSELSVLEDVGHEKVPAVQEDAYHHRYVEGDRTDVEIVTRALELGYFEVPRRATLTEIADELGISDVEASERLRRETASMLRDQP